MSVIVFIFLLLFCNSCASRPEKNNEIIEEYIKYFRFIRNSNRSGFRTIDKINQQGLLFDASGNVSIEGQGFFRVRDYFSGKCYYTRNGFIEVTQILVTDDYHVYNADFKIYEVQDETDLNNETKIEDIQFSIWEPIGEVKTVDGLYFEFDNFKKANGKVALNKLEAPIGDLNEYLDNMHSLVIKMRKYKIINVERYELYIQAIENMKNNYSIWIDNILSARSTQEDFLDFADTVGFLGFYEVDAQIP